MTTPADIVHVGIVDDHTLFREGLGTLLSSVAWIRVIAVTSTVGDVLRLPESAALDVLLLDVELGDVPVRASLARLRREHPSTRVVVLTMHRDAAMRRLLLAEGAADFLTKDRPSCELIERIATVSAAGSSTAASVDIPPALLSDREREVLRLVSAAQSNAQIAEQLHLAPGTVKRHVYNIFRKLDVSSRVAAVATAARVGLIDIG